MKSCLAGTKDKVSIYLKAAHLVERRNEKKLGMLPTCWALREAGANESQMREYKDLILGGTGDVVELWGHGNEYSDETYEARVLLLCFAAAAAERP